MRQKFGNVREMLECLFRANPAPFSCAPTQEKRGRLLVMPLCKIYTSVQTNDRMLPAAMCNTAFDADELVMLCDDDR